MRRRTLGFSLFDVMIALVMLSIGLSAVLALFANSTDAVRTGQRWTAMAASANRQLGRMEQGYRAGFPRCAVPAAGSLLGADGVALSWIAAGDSVATSITMEVRAASGRRRLVDTVAAGFLCQ